MANITWIKIATDMYEDEKLLIIESMPECDAILVIWTKLMLRAGKCNAGGWIYLSEGKPYTEEMLAAIFRRPVNTIRLALKTLENLGMIEISDQGIYIVNFASYQNTAKMEIIKEQERIRKANNRANLKLKSVTVPDMSQTVTQQNKIKIKNKDIEEDITSKEGANAPLFKSVNPYDCCRSFEDYKNLLSTTDNQVGFLIEAFKRIHSHAPASDFDDIGGRLGKLWANNHRDTGLVLKAMWNTASQSIAGSHINYIDRTLRGRSFSGNNDHTRTPGPGGIINGADPDKFFNKVEA